MNTKPLPDPQTGVGYGLRGIDSYAAESPVLDLREYLNGPLTAAGVFFGLSGRVDRRFTVEMVGQTSGNKVTLNEWFRYDDGETGERCWEMEFQDHGNFAATAQDVEGKANGAQRGNAAVMRYRLRLPRQKGEIVVGMKDWFYLTDDGTLINRARMSKFGIKVGEVVASFRRNEPGTATGKGAGGS